MKKLLIILSFLTSLAINAQTVQNGIVQEYNEKVKKTPLAGVELNVRSANSTVSGKNGQFSLHFLTLKPGERINVRKIEKEGYAIFNKEAIEQWNLNPKEPFIIIMCNAKEYKKLRDTYYMQAKEKYAKQYISEENRLKKMKKEGLVKEAEYKKRIENLKEFYNAQYYNLNNYIDHFSRIDLTELSNKEKYIIDLLNDGKYEDAISEYENNNFVSEYKKGLQEQNEIDEAINKLLVLRASKRQANSNLLTTLNRQIDAMQCFGDHNTWDKMLHILTEVATVDSLNFDWNIKSGDVLLNNLISIPQAYSFYKNAFDIAKTHYGECSQEFIKANFCLGKYYHKISKPSEARDLFKLSLSLYENNYPSMTKEIADCYKCLGLQNLKLAFDDSSCIGESLDDFKNALLYRKKTTEIQDQNLAEIYELIARTYYFCGDFNQALNYSLSSKVIRENCDENNDLEKARLFELIGCIYEGLKDYPESLRFYNLSLELRLQLPKEFQAEAAVSYGCIGMIYFLRKEFDKSLEYCKKAYELGMETMGPINIKMYRIYPKLAVAYKAIGNLTEYNKYRAQTSYFTLKYITIPEDRWHPKVADLYESMGRKHMQNNDYTSALEYFINCLTIREVMLNEQSQKILDSYKNLRDVYYALGDTFNGSLYETKMSEMK